jgi:hypothetical protein
LGGGDPVATNAENKRQAEVFLLNIAEITVT